MITPSENVEDAKRDVKPERFKCDTCGQQAAIRSFDPNCPDCDRKAVAFNDGIDRAIEILAAEHHIYVQGYGDERLPFSPNDYLDKARKVVNLG